MWDTMVDLCFVRIGFCCWLRNALGNHFSVATLVAGELAVGTLHTSGILEEFSTESTTHNVVELLLNEFVTVLFVYFFLLLTNGTLTAKTKICSFVSVLLCYKMLA
jgi:hypothetical protein